MFDPQTYDVPRSCVQNLSKSSDPVDEPVLYSNQQPLYQNEEEEFITKTSPLDLYDVPRSQLPIYGQSLARLRRYGHQASESSLLAPRGGITTSLQNVNLGNFASARSSSSCDLGLPPSGRIGSNRTSPDNCSSINLAETGTIPGNTAHDSSSIISQTSSGTSQVQLRNSPHRRLPFSSTNCIPTSSSSTGIPINHSNRSSVQSESAESGIGMVSSPPTSSQDLYDVPRSTAVRVQTRLDGGVNGQQLQQSNGTSSRPQSSLSASSSGMGLSIANSDSKDSLDLYDVPRSAKSYVNHMETKYDHVVHNKHQGSSAGSTTSLSRDSTLTKAAHSRHNSTSSIFSAYGYARQGSAGGGVSGADFTDGKRPGGTISQDFGSMNPPDNAANDLYDVPRSSCAVPPPNPRTHRGISGGFGASSSSASIASSRSVVSLLSDGDLTGSASMLYDIPPSFTKKVSLTDSSETLSFKDSGSESGQSGNRSDLKLGASSSSLSTSPGRRRNHVLRRGSQGVSNNKASSSSSLGFTGAGVGSADVKILPLGPKAAVSVCEKLRHEVITSIGSILNQVKPKWRSKENLTAIMPDLRFSCCRLSLAIKVSRFFPSPFDKKSLRNHIKPY